MGYEWLIECASRRQKWIDMGQSLNLYLAEPSGKKLHTMYLMAWKKGLKTTYYLRSLGATRIEKSTLDINKYTEHGDPIRQTWKKPQAQSSVRDPQPEAVHQPEQQPELQPVLQENPETAKISQQIACSIENGENCEACQ
jgi:ribonucleoside-diphosphate reductase alpha chain